MTEVQVPSFGTFMNPVIQALKSLGGSGTIEEINSRASEIASLSDEQLEVSLNMAGDPIRRGDNGISQSLSAVALAILRYQR